MAAEGAGNARGLQERLRPSWRRQVRQSPLTYMLLLSLLLHLSMVTLFKVMVYFPYDEVQYYSFRIVPELQPASEESEVAASSFQGEQLRISGLMPEDLELPEIALPTLELAELERLREAQTGLKATSLYDRLYNEEPQDSWARLVRGGHRVGESLAELARGENPLLDEAEEEDVPVIARVGAGFMAEIVWPAGATKRRLLFSPPLPALQQLNADQLSEPIMLSLGVNPEGKVTSVFNPQVLERAELLEEIAQGVYKYRFEPLIESSSSDRFARVTMYLRPAREGEDD